jgi:hypothetical protein
MPEKSQFKVEALTFAHNLQALVRVVAMYNVDHPAADRAVQAAYTNLTALLKQSREFTLGFVNQRLLLNNILTTDPNSALLENEFAKRGVGAVTFPAGISLRDFKRGIAVLATRPKVIEDQGGLRKFLERNPVETVRIIPATHGVGESTDTDLEIDAKTYLSAQAVLESHAAGVVSGVEQLLQSGQAGNPVEVLSLCRKATRAALSEPDKDFQEALETWTRLIPGLPPGALLAALPPEKQRQLQGRTIRDAAVDLAEDEAAQWAAEQFAKAPGIPEAQAAREEVLKGLLRAVRATQAAPRLLMKIRQSMPASAPAGLFESLQRDVQWYALSRPQKYAELMLADRFSEPQFRRLMSYLQETMNAGATDEALQVIAHYWAVLEATPRASRADDLTRLAELLRAMATPQMLGFIHTVAARLSQELRELAEPGYHPRVAEALAAVAQIAGRYEDFEFVQKIAADLKSAATLNPAQHEECCTAALGQLLEPATARRVVERYLEERDNAAWARTATALLKSLGAQGAEPVFQALEEESAAPNRMRLIRLIGQLGQPAAQATRKRLSDERWYVVRNACFVLGSLGDSDLAQQLRPALRHPDFRVQQAALTAIMKSQTPGRAAVLAESLAYLQGPGLEMALDELTFLKDPASVAGLTEFLQGEGRNKPAHAERATQMLAVIPAEPAQEFLGKVLADAGQPAPLRRAALLALSHCPFATGQRILTAFAAAGAGDPLVAECRSILKLPAA